MLTLVLKSHCLSTAPSQIFNLLWGPTTTALAAVFDITSDHAIALRVVDGFRACGDLCARFGANDVFDRLLVSMCKRTQLVAVDDGEAPCLGFSA